ncbi:hypothetical protein [Trinickia terrae]|nr:hypothetical protein [Trinickia terrae]
MLDAVGFRGSGANLAEANRIAVGCLEIEFINLDWENTQREFPELRK